MRSRVTNDGTKLIMSTSDGYLMVVHNLDLTRLARDLFGFIPRHYYMCRHGYETDFPEEDEFRKYFTAKRNRVEIIDDFPMNDEPNMIPSLEVFCFCCSLLCSISVLGPRGSAVERQSLASILLPSCARPVADG